MFVHINCHIKEIKEQKLLKYIVKRYDVEKGINYLC